MIIGGESRHVIGYMKDFLFRPEQARTPVKALSGGERGRLMLARALARPSNLLVLDEPTNDLDLETLDLLQEMLADYPGTLILVSHDRDFLDRVVDLGVVAEGDGRWTEYAGGYSDMVAQRGSGIGAKAAATRPAAAAAQGRERAAPQSRRRALLQGPARAEDAAGADRHAQNGDPPAGSGALRRRPLPPRPEGFEATNRKLSAGIRAEVSGLEEEWLQDRVPSARSSSGTPASR